MLISTSKSRLAAVLLCVITIAHLSGMAAFGSEGTPSGTIISNRAEGTYEDASGMSFGVVSQTVSLTVATVPALMVTPDETAPSATAASYERITRTFQVCNTGNTPAAYTITEADVNSPAVLVNLYFDNDADGTVSNTDTLISLVNTLSPVINPGLCIPVLAVVDTNDSPVNSNLTIRLTARSSVAGSNGQPEDSGTIINTLGAGAIFTSPTNPGLPPIKTVNGTQQVIVSPGTPFTYTIAFRNSGGTVARSVVITDDLLDEIDFAAGSLTLDTRSLTDALDADEGEVQGRRLTVRLTQVLPDQVVTISFRATLNGNAPSGRGVSNFATLSGQNVAPTRSSTAIAVIDPFGTVFAGRGGSTTPIAGAPVGIYQDQNGANPLAIPGGTGFTPNLQNDNPYPTDGQGHFSFALLPTQFGSDSSPARYFIKVSASGYSTRMLEITMRQTTSGLFAMTVHAVDGQPLARAGGFDLVNDDVQIDDLAAVVLNIPMFEPHGLEIMKSADRPRALFGDAVAYRVEVRNPTAATVSDLVIHDHLPNSFNYVSGSGRLTKDGALDQAIEPDVVGSEITFHVGVLASNGTARLTYRARVGANAKEGEQENVAFATGAFPSGERVQTPPAKASVIVGSGVFSSRQIIVGRVFADTNGSGAFDDGDKPLAGTRLYLNSGQSVVTDSKGLYNFPSLGDGPQVISLDPITLPKHYALADGGTLAGHSWTRLLRTPLGGGALLRQNFVLIARTDGLYDLAAELASTTDAVAAKPEPGATPEPVKELNARANTSEVKAPTSGEFVTTETLDPVEPGAVKVLKPAPNEVILSPALQLETRVALDWTVKIEVNDKPVSDKNIGTTRVDHKNNVTTFTFVGLEVRPGANRVHVTAVSPTGTDGQSVELNVVGRGPARRLEIVSEKSAIQADGRDSTTLHLHAFDQWNNPAADEQVAIETSAGELLAVDNLTGGIKADEEASRAIASLKQSGNTPLGRMLVSLAGGQATVKLIASGAPGEARLHAQMGQNEAETKIRIVPESRPTILIGLAEVSVGQSLPEVNLRGEEGHYRSRFSFFYSGRVWRNSLLTLAYDSQRPINRTAGRDRLFQLDPLDRVYPLFGDSSTRYEAAQSNSKVYARLDHNRSFAMFGDFETDMEDLSLAGYSRKLTGVKVHAENSGGDFVTLTGARPDTAFARDVFPAGALSLMKLSHGELLPGSEVVALEVRDRRNPEITLSREVLSRSIDYNLDSITGELFLLRYISAFDFNLNLVQLVVTYEHRANSLSAAVYTARGRKTFSGLGLQLGFAGVMQRQEDAGSFLLAGIDGEKTLPNKGTLRFAYARSQGEITGTGNSFDNASPVHNGSAYLVELNQPLSFYQGVVRARYAYSSASFLNPFGASVTAGSRRGEISFELKPRASSLLHFGFTDERNHTVNVNNSRVTFSAYWDEVIAERIRLHLGFDHRSLNDESSAGAVHTTDSNLLTVGAEVKLTDKLEVGVKREQNLGEADPTFPDQTTISATYRVNQWAKVFLTQRLAAAAIMPIGDFSTVGSGFSSTGSRRETAIGVETKLGKYSAMTGRYQLENGINGTDSFAILGLQTRLPVTKAFSLDLGFERGFHVAGEGQSFNSATFGLGWQPTNDFRASARYEFRNRAGNGQLLALGAAGRIRDGITALGRFQMSRTGFSGRDASSMEGMAALAIRPLESDRFGLLFSFNHRSLTQEGGTSLLAVATRDRIDSLSTDGYYQLSKRLEAYARLAVRFNANGQADLPYVSTLTYMTQERLQYRLSHRFDLAGELRYMVQPSSNTQRSSYGAELGFWAVPDLRLGLGYNFNSAREPAGSNLLPSRRGVYFTITSKLSNLFDLFGTSKNDLVGTGNETPDKVVPPK